MCKEFSGGGQTEGIRAGSTGRGLGDGRRKGG